MAKKTAKKTGKPLKDITDKNLKGVVGGLMASGGSDCPGDCKCATKQQDAGKQAGTFPA